MGRCLEWTSGLGKPVTTPQNRGLDPPHGIMLSTSNLGDKAVCHSNAGWARVAGSGLGKSDGARFPTRRARTCLFTISMAIFLLLSLDCGTRHATLEFTAPRTAVAGTAFTVMVTVMIGSERDTIINNRVHFTSSDPAAVLPGDYYFTPADAGSHTWANDFVLMTPGNQTISGEIIEATGINGTTTVAVAP